MEELKNEVEQLRSTLNEREELLRQTTLLKEEAEAKASRLDE